MGYQTLSGADRERRYSAAERFASQATHGRMSLATTSAPLRAKKVRDRPSRCRFASKAGARPTSGRVPKVL